MTTFFKSKLQYFCL